MESDTESLLGSGMGSNTSSETRSETSWWDRKCGNVGLCLGFSILTVIFFIEMTVILLLYPNNWTDINANLCQPPQNPMKCRCTIDMCDGTELFLSETNWTVFSVSIAEANQVILSYEGHMNCTQFQFKNWNRMGIVMGSKPHLSYSTLTINITWNTPSWKLVVNHNGHCDNNNDMGDNICDVQCRHPNCFAGWTKLPPPNDWCINPNQQFVHLS